MDFKPCVKNECPFDKNKHFCEYRNEATDPFVQLFYDILSRYHTHDYDIAISGMSDGLRDIIMACNEKLQNKV